MFACETSDKVLDICLWSSVQGTGRTQKSGSHGPVAKIWMPLAQAEGKKILEQSLRESTKRWKEVSTEKSQT